MSELATYASAKLAELADELSNPEARLEDRAAAYAVLQQVKLRLDRVLKANRDDLIVGMERDGLKELGPLSVKGTAVDPKYVVNDEGNWADSTIQDALKWMRDTEALREYIRHVPEHLEIDVPALVEAMRLGSRTALDLYGEMNRRGWRVEQARRLSLAVREAKTLRGAAA